MHSSSVALILLLSIAAAPVLSISCYSYNGMFNRKEKVLHGQKFCTAVYEVNSGEAEAAFGGGDLDPTDVRFIRELPEGKDCFLKHVDNKMGFPSSDIWTCFCFDSFCNFPFNWEEFTKRGFTLAALPQKNI